MQTSGEVWLVRPAAAGAVRAGGPVLAGVAVAATIGAYAAARGPAGDAGNVVADAVGRWLAVGSVGLAAVQLVSALALAGRPGPAGARSGVALLHRWSGRLAFLAAVPLAVHCWYALGLPAADGRALVRSLAGCLLVGAFTAKMLAVRRPGMPAPVVPVLGWLTTAALVTLAVAAALWSFGGVGLLGPS